MNTCFFASDLHGSQGRYLSLFSSIERERPRAVFLGGDLFPGLQGYRGGDFLDDFLAPGMLRLHSALGSDYPRVFLILGNDDSKLDEPGILRWMEGEGLWEYLHNRQADFEGHPVYGYSYVPPTPFLNKDWERYDISRYVDPGSIPPAEGWHSREEPPNQLEHATIQADLEDLAGKGDLSRAIFLFHTPPYQTALDRAALDGRTVDHVPLDLHVGSIAVKEFIRAKQPLLTLHGHVHESARLTGAWMDRLGRTTMISAAHHGPELALVRFSLDDPAAAERELIPPAS